MAKIRITLSRSDLKEIMFSAVRESGYKPVGLGRDWLYTILDGFGRVTFIATNDGPGPSPLSAVES